MIKRLHKLFMYINGHFKLQIFCLHNILVVEKSNPVYLSVLPPACMGTHAVLRLTSLNSAQGKVTKFISVGSIHYVVNTVSFPP